MRTLALALVASGCWASCFTPDACLRFDPKTIVAFAGVAKQVTLLSNSESRRSAKVTFRVDEVLYGLAPGAREVVVHMDPWPSETPKEALLVEGVRRNGEIHADGCETGVFSMPGRPGELDFFRQVRDGRYRPALKAIVTSRWGNMAGAQVRLTRPGFERTAQVPEWGVAELKDLTPGKYRLSVRQNGFYAPPDQEVTLTANHCTEARVSMTAGGSITGRALDSRGAVIPGLVVDLVTTDGGGHEARTDAAGRFSFGGLPPGSYTLGTNRNVEIGAELLTRRIEAPRCQQPGNITVKAFQQVGGLEFRCPGLGVVRLIRVRVIDGKTGRPMAGVEVRSPGSASLGNDPNQVDVYGVTTDALGWARITAMSGAWLEVQAVADDGRKSPVVKVARQTGSQVLTLKL